ncbi:MAG: ribonuclease HII [Methanoculleaceae archaeon]
MVRMIGIDEAGRGSVLGPLVLCGVTGDSATEEALLEMDIRDSKACRPDEREEMARWIRRCAEAVTVVAVPPSLIDRAVSRNLLNLLEAQVMAYMIDRTSPDTAYLDAPGRIPEGIPDYRFSPRNFRRIIRSLVRQDIRIVAENRADERYPLVSAASIIAKVERDRAVSEIALKYGCDIGSGYPDRKTVSFLTGYYRSHRSFPAEMRLSWKTRQQIIRSITEKELDEFFPDTGDRSEQGSI